MDPERPVTELVHLFYSELWNSWNDGMVDDLLTEDFRFRGSLGQVTHGRDEWRSYRDMIRAGSPDFHNEVQDLVTSPSRAAARLRYTGTHLGPLLGVEPSGKSFSYAGAAFFTAEQDRLGEAWVIGDVESLRRQLTESA
jgi:steroid delta-isomerase-like uncharacterized protein